MIAAWMLGRANLSEEEKAEAAAALILCLDGDSTSKDKRAKEAAFGILCGIKWGAASLGSVVLILFFVVSSSSHFGILYFALIYALGIAGLTLALTPLIPVLAIGERRFKTNKIRLEAARSLGLLRKREAVPALLRASQNTNFLRLEGREALQCTLPSLTFDEHYGTLGDDVVPNLCRLLKGSPQIEGDQIYDWQMTLLGALEQVGDARSVKPLERFTHEDQSEGATVELVYQKAVQILEAVRVRAARETEHKTLLRGSKVPAQADTLLRPHEEGSDTPPNQLLRPTSQG